MSPRQRRRRIAATLLLALLSLGLFVVPGVTVLATGLDPALAGPGIPRTTWSWHRSLSARYATWARERVASGRAAQLTDDDISGTEWPLFGTVFYLLATEELEKAAKAEGREPPSVYARPALEACAALLADPKQAEWVKRKYGPDYLHRENVFYRYLVIFGFTLTEQLTGDRAHHDFLLDQVTTLAAEFEKSPHLLLEDYPYQCFPSDVLWAIVSIRRADAVLGTDHSKLIERARQAFRNPKLLGPRKLPPYMADKNTAAPTEVRGCSTSSILHFAAEVDPALAKEWFERYEHEFWQERSLFAGFREFPPEDARDWWMDVDAGPVVQGFGVSACAFGVGAARRCGRFDRALPLAGESVAWSWPLPTGELLVPQVLSNAGDAPLLGESGVLYNLTRQPAPGTAVVTGGAHAGQFWLLLGGYFGVPAYLALREWVRWRRWHREGGGGASEGRERAAVVVALVAGTSGLGAFALGWRAVGLVLLLATIAVPEAVAGRATRPAGGAPPAPA